MTETQTETQTIRVLHDAVFGPAEELDPELQEYLEESDTFGEMIRHPLVFSIIHVPQMNRWVNNALRSKRAALAVAEADSNWRDYVYLHERPYRVTAFTEIMDNMDDAAYWALLGRIWIDSENIRQNPRIWQTLLRSERGDREAIMRDHEREALAELPATITVYQGHTDRRHDGWSWTTERHTAEWFATRFATLEGGRPVVTTATVAKADVIAYFTGRNESEILAPRTKVRRTDATEVTA